MTARSRGFVFLRRTLHPYACFVALATLVLICFGAIVTTKDVGMAVPDWPQTFGENMLTFPPEKWQGGVGDEHRHRLAGFTVGVLTLVLFLALLVAEPRPWVKWLGAGALVIVAAQGVLGGLRVVLDANWIGIVHAAAAQFFFLVVCFIAIFTSPHWTSPREENIPGLRGLRVLSGLVAVLVFAQLLLGAGMRHQHAGLAVPDFPLAYGRIWPRTDAQSLHLVNQRRVGIYDHSPVTAAQVHLHMAHRFGGVLIFLVVVVAAVRTLRVATPGSALRRLTAIWVGLVSCQVLLGASTVWSGKNISITTAHVAGGACVLFVSTLLWVWSSRNIGTLPESGEARQRPQQRTLADVPVSAHTVVPLKH